MANPRRASTDQRVLVLAVAVAAAALLIAGVVLLLGPGTWRTDAAPDAAGAGSYAAGEDEAPGVAVLEGDAEVLTTTADDESADAGEDADPFDEFLAQLPEDRRNEILEHLEGLDERERQVLREQMAAAFLQGARRPDPREARERDEEEDEEEDDGRSVVVTGVVRNQDSAPIHGAEVRIHGGGVREVAYTTEEGTFQIRFEPSESSALMLDVRPPMGSAYRPFEPIAFDPGNPRSAVLTNLPQQPAPGSVSMQPVERVASISATLVLYEQGDALRGLVLDDSEQPLAGAVAEGEVRHAVGTVPFRIESGADGRFEIPELLNRSVVRTLNVSHPDYDPETRRDLTARDGEQVFRLERHNRLELVVRWGGDNMPVSFYSYRLLLVSDVNDWTVDVGRADRTVSNMEGRTTLEGVASGRWRVEVAVLDGDGNPTA